MLGCRFAHRQAQGASGRHHPFAGISIVLFFSTCLLGCYWLQYNKLMQTHITLLLAMADKMIDLLDSKEPIPAAAMAEFTYPLTRARDFTRIAAKRYRTRPSLKAFSHFLDTYSTLVQETDRLRLQTSTDSPPFVHFRQLVKTLRQEAQQVTRLLAQEEE
jgi:hypothetical protein